MTNESPEKTRLRASMATLCSIVTNLITPRQKRKAPILHHLPRWLSSGRAAPATNGNGVPVARARITAGENFNFAKRSQHERKELIPKMKMCATPPLLLGQWKQKVILRNKTGMSARSSPPKMKMWDQEELLRCWVGQTKHKSDFGETNPILPQAQGNKDISIAVTVYFCSAWAGVFFARPAAFRSRSIWIGIGRYA